MTRLSHVVGIDDAPFDPAHRGDVTLVGAVFGAGRLEGVLCGRVRRDGRNATARIARLIGESRFAAHLQVVLLQGITLAGFNVVDIHALHATLGLPVIVVTRRRPDLAATRRALLDKVPGGARKWRLIEAAGPVEPAGALFIQRAGIEHGRAATLVQRLAVNSLIPEPLRTAHLIAAGLAGGRTRQRV